MCSDKGLQVGVYMCVVTKVASGCVHVCSDKGLQVEWVCVVTRGYKWVCTCV